MLHLFFSGKGWLVLAITFAAALSVEAISEAVSGDPERYDLVADPAQMTNVVADPDYAAVLAELQETLDELRDD
jgi:hypothetical protein